MACGDTMDNPTEIDMKAAFSASDAAAVELMVELRRRKEALHKASKFVLRLEAAEIDDAVAEVLYLAALGGDAEKIATLLEPWRMPATQPLPERAMAPAAPPPQKGKGKTEPTRALPPAEPEVEPEPAPPAWQVRDIYGFDPLAMASAAGQLEAVRALLEGGADINARNPLCGRTALHRAVEAGRLEIADVLLSKGAASTAVARDGSTSLHEAASRGNAAMVERLLQDAPVDSRDLCECTSLMLAAAAGHVDICSMLLDRGADIEATDESGWTPLIHACAEEQALAAAELARRGANQSHLTKGGRSIQHLSAKIAGSLPEPEVDEAATSAPQVSEADKAP